MQVQKFNGCTKSKPAKQEVNMKQTTPKIESTDQAWESGTLGASPAHTKPAPADMEAAIDASLGLQAISIRLPKQLIDGYKLIGAHHGVGYQPLMRDILQRALPELMREVLQHHEAKAVEVEY
jgi:hypothetical protein